MARWVALLRAVNVGRSRRVSMQGLREAAEEVGLNRVSTYLQSGNLIFEADQETSEISTNLGAEIEKRFGIEVPMIFRRADELGSIARSHPFESDEADHRFLMVAFLDGMPAEPSAFSSSPEEFAPDRVALSKREIYIHYPQGSARSKLTADLITRRLEVVCTMRNWRTVRKLAQLVAT